MANGSPHLPFECTTKLNDLLKGVVSDEIRELIFAIADEIADSAFAAGVEHAENLYDTASYD